MLTIEFIYDTYLRRKRDNRANPHAVSTMRSHAESILQVATDQTLLKPNDFTWKIGLYLMVWEDDLSPVGDGQTIEYRFIKDRKVPATNKPGQGFTYQRYITVAQWKARRCARKIEIDRIRWANRDRPPDRP